MTKEAENYGRDSVFPQTLRKLMREGNVTHKKLSEICSVKAQSISQWANGDTRPDILSLVKIAKFFNVSTDYLLGEDGDKFGNEDIIETERMLNHLKKMRADANKDYANSNYNSAEFVFFLGYKKAIDDLETNVLWAEEDIE